MGDKLMSFYRMVHGVEKLTVLVPSHVDVASMSPEQAHDFIESNSCLRDVELMDNEYPHQVIPYELTKDDANINRTLDSVIFFEDQG